MLLTLVIILILIWAAVVGSLYSNFLVFYQNFTETENYHKARYASIAATERAELVIKQREPWYIWSWWWILGETSSAWNSPSDKLISDFSYLWNNGTSANKSTVFWNINSRTDRIPTTGNGNVEKLLSADDSPNYNMMDYKNSETILLYYDEWLGNPYQKTNSHKPSKLVGIVASIRLPSYIRNSFWKLNTNESLVPWWYADDALVDWQLRWKYYSNNFTIFATQNAAWWWASDNDSSIRESDLNNGSWITLEFKTYWNPKNTNNDSPTIISPDDQNIINIINEDINNRNGFKKILNDYNRFSNLEFRLSLLNLVLWAGELSYRYPFLEYSIQFEKNWSDPIIVSDKYYTIKTEWNYGDYKIDTVIYKPTIVESILKSFTTIL